MPRRERDGGRGAFDLVFEVADRFVPRCRESK